MGQTRMDPRSLANLTPFAHGNKLATGGRRAGSGRTGWGLDAAIRAARHAAPRDAAKCLARVQAIAHNPAAPGLTRVRALIYLVDRALGPPRRRVEPRGPVTIRLAGTVD